MRHKLKTGGSFPNPALCHPVVADRQETVVNENEDMATLSMIEKKVLIVNMKERTVRDIWKSPEQQGVEAN